MDVRLQQVIEQYKDKTTPIRLFYMDDDGTDWLEESGCIGNVVNQKVALPVMVLGLVVLGLVQ
uniref:hypothetical protein n=1 Tax=Escherichia coli TaxID=562 RepID=UPI001F15F26A